MADADGALRDIASEVAKAEESYGWIERNSL
jgi:hypothetical protein